MRRKKKSRKQYIYAGNRDYDDPAYKRWRREVIKRDGRCCQWPDGCTTKYRLHCHHIKKWSSYPSLRFEIDNGITLCKKHHDMVFGKEEDYEKIFYIIVAQNKLDRLEHSEKLSEEIFNVKKELHQCRKIKKHTKK